MTSRSKWRRLQEGAGNLAGRLGARLKDDGRFWRVAIKNAPNWPGKTTLSLWVIAICMIVAFSDTAQAAVAGFVALQWGGLLSPTSGLMVAIFVVSSYAMRARPSFASMWAIALYVGSFALANTWRLAIPSENYDLARQLYQIAAFDVLAVQGWLLWYFVRRPTRLREGDVVAQLYWTVYAVAETGQVFEYLGCKILYDPYTANELATLWATAVEASSCGRAFGTASQYVFPAITTLLLFWPAYRAFQAWRRS